MTSQQKVQAIQEIAPLWQSILKGLQSFDQSQQKVFLEVYLQDYQANSDNLHELDTGDAASVRNALKADDEAKRVLLKTLPDLLPHLVAKPVLHMSAAKMLQTLLPSATVEQKANGRAAIHRALEYSPTMLENMTNPLELVRRQSQSRSIVDQVNQLKQEIRATEQVMEYEDELRALEEGAQPLGT